METYYILHYEITYGTDTINGVTTVRSNPGSGPEEAKQTLIKVLGGIDAKNATSIVILSIKSITKNDYEKYLDIIKPM